MKTSFFGLHPHPPQSSRPAWPPLSPSPKSRCRRVQPTTEGASGTRDKLKDSWVQRSLSPPHSPSGTSARPGLGGPGATLPLAARPRFVGSSARAEPDRGPASHTHLGRRAVDLPPPQDAGAAAAAAAAPAAGARPAWGGPLRATGSGRRDQRTPCRCCRCVSARRVLSRAPGLPLPPPPPPPPLPPAPAPPLHFKQVP